MSASGLHGQKRVQTTEEAQKLKIEKEAIKIQEYRKWILNATDLVFGVYIREERTHIPSMH
jgi:hypothetical protein